MSDTNGGTESGDAVTSDADVGDGPDGTDEVAGAETGGAATDVDEFTTDRRTVSPGVQVQWAAHVLVAVAVLGVVATVVASRAGVDPLAGVGLAAVLGVAGLVWVVLRYRVWAYEVRADALYLERGVVTHTRTLVPYVRLQHVDTSRSPLERALGLSTLVVYTAGSRGADVSVPGLRPEEAADLQSRLKELAIEAEGGDAV